MSWHIQATSERPGQCTKGIDIAVQPSPPSVSRCMSVIGLFPAVFMILVSGVGGRLESVPSG